MTRDPRDYDFKYGDPPYHLERVDPMNLSIFGATGALGSECVNQCLDAGHRVTLLARTPSKLPSAVRERVEVIEGDGLVAQDVEGALSERTDAVLFAVGIDRRSPEDLCTSVTRNIFDAMRRHAVRRFVFCGGGSTPVPGDVLSFGSRFVEFFASTLMGLRHRDKEHQLALLAQSEDIDWLGVRPLQLRRGPKRGVYRVGFDRYSGLSKISFADCADAMIGMLDDDTWIHKAPIVQY